VGGGFQLVDHGGNTVSQATYAGRYMLLFFGLTRCRMVCPRALYKLSVVLEAPGPLVQGFQPLYVTVNPQRDTPEVMRELLHPYPRFTGLTGTRAQVEAVMSSFRVFARRQADPEDDQGYVMPHTAITYFLDQRGEYVGHLPDALDEGQFVLRLRAMLGCAVER
jgi:protein SCO1/2